MHEKNINGLPEAYINNWQYSLGGLVGSVSDHPRQNEFHSLYQRTSPIARMDDENEGWAETRNTFYILGNKA
jgi:hypothetical protein